MNLTNNIGQTTAQAVVDCTTNQDDTHLWDKDYTNAQILH